MGLDPLSPVSPARVSCLLLPCGRITRARFLTFVERLRREDTVRLGDVSPNSESYRNIFSPLAFPTGSMLYHMSLSAPSPSYIALSPFELYRQIMVVIAIADGSQLRDNLDLSSPRSHADLGATKGKSGDIEDLQNSLAMIKEQYPSALVHQVFIFDCDTSFSELPVPLVSIPSLAKSKTTTMKTIMCDLTTLLLAEMTSYAKSLQALPNIETPKSTPNEHLSRDYHPAQGTQTESFHRPESRISGTSNAQYSSLATEAERHQHRRSVANPVSTASTGIRERSRSTSNSIRVGNPPMAFAQNSGMPEVPTPSAEKDTPKQPSKDRVPIQGFGSGSVGERARNKARGRIGVVMGSMYLLAGRWPDAIKELIESAAAAKANSDHVWHAKGLDYILVCLLMYAWAGMDFEIPQICYPIGEKANPALNKSSRNTPTSSMPDVSPLRSSNTANRLVSLQNLCHLLPDLINNILHLYVRAATFTADQIPQVSFAESTIRFAKLLTTIQVSHGILDDEGLQSVVFNTDRRITHDTIPSQISSFPTKSDIASVLFRAFPNTLPEYNLEITARVMILTGIASVLARLGYHRKKVFVLRELMSLLLPALVQSRKDSAAELGVHPAASLSNFDLGVEHLESGPVSSATIGSEHGAQGFLVLICEVYGAMLTSSVPSDILDAASSTKSSDKWNAGEEYNDTTQAIIARALKHVKTRSFGNMDLKLDILRSCINLCEALSDLHGVSVFSGHLLRTAGSGIAPGPDSSDGSPSLSIEEQLRLSNNVIRTANAARHLGIQNVEAEYWDEFLVRDIEVIKTSFAQAPTARRKEELEASKVSGIKQSGPFIYNPFTARATSTSTEPMLVAHEEALFLITLQNLYDFDLEIEWVKLDVPHNVMKSQALGVTIGPYRTQTMQLLATPQVAGALSFTGCIAKVRGCRERQFPLFKAPWTNGKETKMKHIGLAAAFAPIERRISATANAAQSKGYTADASPIPATLVANVIEHQPNIIVKATSLSQSAVMLLDGETKKFTITLKNVSQIPADLLLLSFSDSTSAALQSALADKSLTSAETYEIELASYSTDVFRLPQSHNDSEYSIPAKGSITLEIEVIGRPGLTHGTVHIDYGYLGVPRSLVKNYFFTRQVRFEIAITVNSSIDLVRNDILPFTSNFTWQNQRRHIPSSDDERFSPTTDQISSNEHLPLKNENRFRFLLRQLGLGTHGSDHCLIVLDFCNAWPHALSISLQVRPSTIMNPTTVDADPWQRAYAVHETLQPGRSSRLVILLPRVLLENPHLPIPSLHSTKKRQFVLSATKVAPEIERTSREAFWYREEILKYIRATWKEESTGRHGSIELRALRLSPRMVDAFKLEDVSIELFLQADITSTSSEMPDVVQLSRSHFCVPVDTFLTLCVRITNRLSQPIYPLLRIQPALRGQPYNIALDLAKKFAFNGLLQQMLPLLKAAEETVVKVGVIWLCSGDYDIGAVVEEGRLWESPNENVSSGETNQTGEELDMARILERNERRIWGARESLVVQVRNETPEMSQ